MAKTLLTDGQPDGPGRSPIPGKAPLVHRVGHVVLVCPKFQVLGIAARWVIALVHYLKSDRINFRGQLKSHAMSFNRETRCQLKLTVPLAVSPTCPRPTIVGLSLLDILPKPLCCIGSAYLHVCGIDAHVITAYHAHRARRGTVAKYPCQSVSIQFGLSVKPKNALTVGVWTAEPQPALWAFLYEFPKSFLSFCAVNFYEFRRHCLDQLYAGGQGIG
jgi:hypothetical protein